jgi:hypothetical protein
MNTPTKGTNYEAAKPTPRVNHALMAHNVDGIVRLICRVVSTNQPGRQVQTSDGAIVHVQTGAESLMHAQGTLIEIIGRVKDPNTIEEFSSIVLREETGTFDFAKYNAFLHLQQSASEIFGLHQ